MQVRRLIRGKTPLLISVPHAGTFVPPDIKERMTDAGRLLPDTDWHIDRLYAFAEAMGIGLLTATHSRYVIDLNRPQDDVPMYTGPQYASRVRTGLVPLQSFSGEAIYREGEEPDGVEKVNRIAAYWLPYHEMLQAEVSRIRDEFGYALLYDAHSVKSRVPRLFDGDLQDLNIGTANGASCASGLAQAVMSAVEGSGYSSILNGRFLGGYITRHYGQPSGGVHALQMEISWKTYMDERYPYNYLPEKAEKLQGLLKPVLSSILEWGERQS